MATPNTLFNSTAPGPPFDPEPFRKGTVRLIQFVGREDWTVMIYTEDFIYQSMEVPGKYLLALAKMIQEMIPDE